MIDQPARATSTGRFSQQMLGVVLVAAALRLWGVDFGLDVDRARPDEEFLVGIAARMVTTGDLNPHFFHYPTLLTYVDAALLWLFGLAEDPEKARLVGRLLTVVAGVGTVLVVAAVGARLYSKSTGVLAAAFLAIAYFHVRESHFGTTDVPFTFLVAASVALGVEGHRLSHRGLLRASAIVAGLATSTKYPGLLAWCPLLFVIATLPGWSFRERARELLLGAALSFGVFALTSPYLFLDLQGALQSLDELTRETWTDRVAVQGDVLYPITFSLRYGLGVPLLSLGLVGLAAGARRFPGLLLLAWAIPPFAVASFTPMRFARYSFPVVAPLCLAAAALLAALPLRRALKLALALLAMFPPLVSSISFDRLLAREDTRSLASAWIDEHLPPGTKIQMSGGYGAPHLGPEYPVRIVRSRLGAVRVAEREGFLVLVTHQHPQLARFSRVDESLRRRLETARLLARFDPFKQPSRHEGVYDSLDAFYLPYAGFCGVERPGPIVSIWLLGSSPP